MHAGQYKNDYTQAENQRFTEQFAAITDAMARELLRGTPSSSADVQELVAQHYSFCSQFWTPSREDYKSLAMSYILPSPYRDTYEAHTPGLGQYHYDAIVVWADNNLN